MPGPDPSARTAVVWLRRDLRLHDHPAIARAARDFDRLAVLYVLDPRLLHGRAASPPRAAFLLGCLEALDGQLRALGSRLHVRTGDPREELLALGADAVLWTSDVSGFARERDAQITAALRDRGTEAIPCPGNYIADVSRVAPQSGGAYTVFTPFFRAWSDAPRRPRHDTPATLPPPPDGLDPGRLPTAHELGLVEPVLPEPIAQPGEPAAQAALAAWLDGPIDHYADRQDGMARKGTSMLSPHLRFGTLSPLALERAALQRDTAGARSWRRQLCWRDFYAHLLLRHPATPREELQPRRRTLRWEVDPEGLEAWRKGRTGVPLVDAGMRQLAATGWMHNRVRLVAGSFLTKDLGLDWREGERHFSALLLDGEPAQNVGNWQWIASVGADPQPVFKRIFNPTLQQRRFDPRGDYVRRWVPELQRVPDEALAEPWTLSAGEQEALGCVIGRDYPAPIVDHADARRRTLARYAEDAPAKPS